MVTNEQALAWIKKYPVPIVCGAVALLAGLALYFRWSAVTEGQELLRQREEQGQRVLANIKNGQSLNEHVALLGEQIKELEGRLIRSDQLAKNLQFFYRIESETAAKILDLRQTGAVAPDPKIKGPKPVYSPIGYTMTLQGNFPQLLAFLTKLESGSQFYRLKTLAVQKSSQEGSTTGLTLNLGLELLGSS